MGFIIAIIVILFFPGLFFLIVSFGISGILVLIPVICLLMLYYHYFAGTIQDTIKLYYVYCVAVNNWKISKLVSNKKIKLHLGNEKIMFENSECSYVMDKLTYVNKKETSNGNRLLQLYFQDKESYKVVKVTLEVYGNSLSTKIYNRLKTIQKDTSYEKIEILELINQCKKSSFLCVDKCIETSGIIKDVNVNGDVSLIANEFENFQVVFLSKQKENTNLLVGEELTIKGIIDQIGKNSVLIRENIFI